MLRGEEDVVDASSSPSPLRTFDADTFPDDTIPDLLATDGRFVTFLRILDIHDPSLLSFLTISHCLVFNTIDRIADSLGFLAVTREGYGKSADRILKHGYL